MALTGCAASSAPAPTEPAPAGHTDEESEAYERARPVFQQYCAKCRAADSGKAEALRHFRMDGYPFGGHHSERIAVAVREVLGASGKVATMPRDRPGAVRGEDLQLILDWADAFDRAHSANPGAHHNHQH